MSNADPMQLSSINFSCQEFVLTSALNTRVIASILTASVVFRSFSPYLVSSITLLLVCLHGIGAQNLRIKSNSQENGQECTDILYAKCLSDHAVTSRDNITKT